MSTTTAPCGEKTSPAVELLRLGDAVQGRSVPRSELKHNLGASGADGALLLSTVVKSLLLELVAAVTVDRGGVPEVKVTVRVDAGAWDLEADLLVSVKVRVKVEVSTSISQIVSSAVIPGVGVTLGNA